MFIGKIIGNVICTQKDEKLVGTKILVVQLLTPNGKDKGDPQIALDGVGVCGIGDVVYLSKGKEGALPFKDKTTPTDLSVVGIIDKINFCEE